MGKGQRGWVVLWDDGRARTVDPDRLAQWIRDGEVDGLALVRRQGEPAESMRPLHKERFYQRIRGVGPSEAERFAHGSRVRGFLGHIAIFAAVGLVAGDGSFPWWMVFWGIGLLGHGVRVLPSLPRLGGGTQALGAIFGVTRFDRLLPASEDHVPAEDPLAAELQREWAGLAPLLERVPGQQTALRQARSRVEALLARGAALDEHLAHEDVSALSREAAQVASQLEQGELDDVTRQALTDAAQAVRERQEAVTALRDARARVRAQARGLLHQLSSVRLLLAREAEDDGDGLLPILERVRAQVEASQEVEEAVARAKAPSALP